MTLIFMLYYIFLDLPDTYYIAFALFTIADALWLRNLTKK